LSRRLNTPLFVAFAVAAFICVAATAAAAPPAGPRLVFLEGEFVEPQEGAKSEPPLRARFVSTDPRGDDARTLKVPRSAGAGGLPFSWNADGSEYAFIGAVPRAAMGGRGENLAYIARADGSGARPIAATKGTSAAVLSPDGRWLAFTRSRLHGPKLNRNDPHAALEALLHGYETRSTWIVPTAGGRPRRLTPSGRHEFAEPTSFSPDGSTLLVTDSGHRPQTEVDAIDLATGKRRTIELEASEASFSPDGSRIAFISYRDHESVPGFDEREGTSEVYVAAADGTGAHRVTETPKFEETAPSWDPSGERLGYLRSPGGILGIVSGRVAESNADGSCTKVLPLPPRRKHGHTLAGEPTWWPGSERGAGPLSC
jgi:WD40-like Beta Propeller Repeat